jgi:hypothetical protein
MPTRQRPAWFIALLIAGLSGCGGGSTTVDASTQSQDATANAEAEARRENSAARSAIS